MKMIWCHFICKLELKIKKLVFPSLLAKDNFINNFNSLGRDRFPWNLVSISGYNTELRLIS